MDLLIPFTLLLALVSLGSTSPVAVKSDSNINAQPDGTEKPPGYGESDEASFILKLSEEVPLEGIHLPSSVDLIDSIGHLSAEKVPSSPVVDEPKKDKVASVPIASVQESVTSQPEEAKSREEADDQSVGVNSAEEKKSEIRTDSDGEIKDKVSSEDEKNNLQPLHYASSSSGASQATNTELPQEVTAISKSPESNVVVKNLVKEKAPVVPEQASPIVQKVAAPSQSVVSSTSITNGVTVVTSTSVPAQYGNGVKPQEGSELIADSVDQATKLLIDLEEQVKIYLNTEDESSSGSSSTSVPLVYGAGSSGIALSNPSVKDISSDLVGESLPPAEDENVNKQGATQIQSMIDEVNRVALNVESVISELVSSRRYVTAAVFRSLLNYLRRVRISLERLQNRMQTIGVGSSATNLSAETAAVGSALSDSASVSSSSTSSSSSSGTSVSNITNGYLEAIRDRIYRITDEIRTLISRLRLTFSPTASSSAPQLQ